MSAEIPRTSWTMGSATAIFSTPLSKTYLAARAWSVSAEQLPVDIQIDLELWHRYRSPALPNWCGRPFRDRS